MLISRPHMLSLELVTFGFGTLAGGVAALLGVPLAGAALVSACTLAGMAAAADLAWNRLPPLALTAAGVVGSIALHRDGSLITSALAIGIAWGVWKTCSTWWPDSVFARTAIGAGDFLGLWMLMVVLPPWTVGIGVMLGAVAGAVVAWVQRAAYTRFAFFGWSALGVGALVALLVVA